MAASSVGPSIAHGQLHHSATSPPSAAAPPPQQPRATASPADAAAAAATPRASCCSEGMPWVAAARENLQGLEDCQPASQPALEQVAAIGALGLGRWAAVYVVITNVRPRGGAA